MTRPPFQGEVGLILHDVDHAEAITEHAGYELRAVWRPTSSGRMEAVSIEISRKDGEAVTGKAVRVLPLGSMIDAIRQQIAPRHDLPEWAQGPTNLGPQRGRPLTGDDLARVAEVYRSAWIAGEPVTEAVSDALHISKATATRRIMEARAAGLLDGVGRRRQS